MLLRGRDPTPPRPLDAPPVTQQRQQRGSGWGPLTEREERFAIEYQIDLCGSAAVRRAGYQVSEANAKRLAYQLLRRPAVLARIRALAADRIERMHVTSDAVLGELYRIATIDVGAAFTADGTLRPINEMPEAVRRAISAIEVHELFEGHGENRRYVGLVKKIKFWNKTDALGLLAKHLKLLTDRVEIDAQVRHVVEVPPRFDRATWTERYTQPDAQPQPDSTGTPPRLVGPSVTVVTMSGVPGNSNGNGNGSAKG